MINQIRISSGSMFMLFLFIPVSLLLGACDFETKNSMMQSPVELHKNTVQEIYPVEEISGGYWHQLSENYKRTGEGGLQIRTAYNSGSERYNAYWARSKNEEIIRILRGFGIRDVRADILPVKDLSDPQILVRYTSYQAKAPKECTGHNYAANVSDPVPGYRIGCTTADLFSRQIYKTRDLVHRPAEMGDQDADRASTIIDSYRAGQRNTPLSGDSTTDFSDEGS